MRLIVLLFILISPVTNADRAGKKNLVDALISWLRSKSGGYLNEKTEIRRVKSEESRLGIFCKEKILKDELILSVPYKCLIFSGEYKDGCGVANNLYKEIKKGSKSKFEPYVNYLLDECTGDNNLPNGWSEQVGGPLREQGKEILEQLLNYEYNNAFPPEDMFSSLHDYEQCIDYDENDEEDERIAFNAFQMSIGKSGIHVPIYDIMSHRHGNFNVEASSSLKSLNDGNALKFRAIRDMEEGEEFFGNYKIAEDNRNELKWKTYGTFEVLRDKGKLEGFPQRWFFDEFFAFELDSIEGSDGEEKFEVKWVGKHPVTRNRDVLLYRDYHLARLEYLRETRFVENENNVPEQEWDVMTKFINALILSLSVALDDIDSRCLLEADEFCENRYNDLSLRPVQHKFSDYNPYPCNEDSDEYFKLYRKVDEISSHYQTAYFNYNPKNRDTCFSLDGTFQICSSYRAHYHEMVVHYTARYLPEVKRVVWVGGGDSMLLHEIIKYPSLELVIGLEIDQKVTRYAFKHFGTQPHWDNSKVQWWYGDAAKSLLMLPKEYYGSFDMVLVDLSETITSNSVTQELDIVDALSLLLKPEGIFVKNEHYIDQMSKVFNYAVAIEYSDVPFLCAQTLVLGSHTIDFMSRDINNHYIDNLYYKHLNHSDDRYETWHDYRKNIGNDQKHCKQPGAPDEIEPVRQESSAGIIMMVDVDDISIGIESSSQLKKILVNVLEKEFKILSSVLPDFNDLNKPAAIVIFGEGYVMARGWPRFKYCSLDIHLWSSFEKHEMIKNNLLAVFQSQSYSSYRIVAGGMLGVSTWKQDEMKRGPKFTQECIERPEIEFKSSVDSNIMNIILKETLPGLVHASNVIVLVLCGGDQPLNQCNSFETVSNIKIVNKTVVLQDCPNLKSDLSLRSKMDCENNILETLKSELTEDEKIHTIIHDSSARKEMAQILLKIMDNRINRQRLLSSEVLVLTTGGEKWKQHWLNILKEEIIIYDPLFRAHTFFNTTDNETFEVGILSNDNDFFRRLVDVASKIEERTGLVSDIKNIYGGQAVYLPNFEATQFIPPEDYDQTKPLEQWKSQEPLAFQIVFQVLSSEIKYPFSAPLVKDALNDAIVNKTVPSESSIYEIKNGIGKGSLLVSFMENVGTIVVTWDGFTHIDINLYTYEENLVFANRFLNDFKKRFPSMKVILRDDQPRGYGRVVNFKSDLMEPRPDPHWS